MSSLRESKMSYSYIVLAGIALFCALLFWIAVFSIAALIVVASADIASAQTSNQKFEECLNGARRFSPKSANPMIIMVMGDKKPVARRTEATAGFG